MQQLGRLVPAGVLAGGMVLAWVATPGWAADSPESQVWQQEIDDLKGRLGTLEERLAKSEAAAAGAEEGSAIIQLPGGLHGIELSGFVDTAYTYNFQEPEDNVNDGRIFDVLHNSFMVHNAQLNLSKGVSDASPVGFNIVLMFGDDAELTHPTGLFAGTDSVDLQQANISYLAPIGNGVEITAGRMATLIGAEVIESINNWNYSRSYMFGLAIPFTHTGIRASTPLTENLTGTIGVNNGWTIANDNNIGKGLEGQLAWESGPLFVSWTGMYSPENNAVAAPLIDDNADRWISDVVASYQITDQLAAMINWDFGYDENAAAIGKNATWQGFAGYLKYDVNDTWSLAGRYEVFRDYDASKLPTLSVATVGDVTFQELTLTSQHQINEHLIARLEYRHDIANGDVFGHDDAGVSNYQDTVALEFIAPF